jgi:hypothetical protein
MGVLIVIVADKIEDEKKAGAPKRVPLAKLGEGKNIEFFGMFLTQLLRPP